ncbi:MAG TPA: ABC transporter ATP-binding protein [Dongiaceae bacterium]|nr:ABC transporter ATP-binding protein [Dongiaceae bacterium]
MILPVLSLATPGNGIHISGTKQSILTGIIDAVEVIGLPINIVTLLGAVVLGLILKSVTAISVMSYVARVMSDMSSRVRLAIIHNLLDVRWGFFTRQPLGRLINGVGPDTAALGESFYTTAQLIAYLMQVGAFVALSLVLSWQLALVELGIGIFMILSFGELVRRSREATRRHTKDMRGMVASFTDAILGIKPIKAMGRQAQLAQLFEKDNRALSESIQHKVVNAEFAGEFQEPVVGAAVGASLYLATTLWGVSPQILFVMFLLMLRMVTALTQAQKLWNRIITTQDHSVAALRLMEETRQAREDNSGKVVPTLTQSIEFRDVHFEYPGKTVLKGANFTIPVGKITTLAGASGAGKSTIADLLLRLHRPDKGAILIDGMNLNELDILKWRNFVGYVPQDVMLFHDSVLHNVTLGQPNFTEPEVRQALTDAGAMEFVEHLENGFGYVVGERGLLLSGGQRQRIAIARALIHKPRLLILDEATTALDPGTEAAICRRVEQLCREQGLTILAVSHQQAWRRIADQVLDVSQGKALPADREVPLSVISQA